MRRAVLYSTVCILVSFILPLMANAAPFPFADDMEGGDSNWVTDTPWAVSDTASHSGTSALCDSPDGYYQNNADVSVTLSSPVDLSASENPMLKFWHRYQFENDYDFGYLEASADNGTSWTTVATFTGTSGGGTQPEWVMETLHLDAFKSETVLIRFRLVSDKTETMDGWCIDDVAIAEQPHSVSLSVDNPSSTSLDLTWTRNLDDAATFGAYKIYRSETPQVDFNSTLVAKITDQATTTFTDTTLKPEHTYFYKIYVVNAFEMYQASKVASGTTDTADDEHGYKWDFEDGSSDWTFSGDWSVTDEDSHGDSGNCITDSPSGESYNNSIDYSAIVTVDLGAFVRPLLSFWNRYSLESYHDYGWVEVSSDGGSHWKRLFFVTGASYGRWLKEEIDLSEYAGFEILIRFRITSDNNGVTNDGWYIDDVEISENNAVTAYPFFDNFEEETSNWIFSSWGRIANGGNTGLWSVTDSPSGSIGSRVYSSMTLRGTFDLLAASNPKLSFWYKFDAYSSDYLGVYVSINWGHTWNKIWERGGDTNNWTNVTLDLSPYRSAHVLIRFQVDDRGNGNGNGAWIDDILIDDAPLDVLLNEPDHITEHSISLSWTESPDSDFEEYRLYRSTSAGITGNRPEDVLIAEIDDLSQTSFTDNLDYPDRTYYYRVFIGDSQGLVSAGSNEISAATLSGTELETFPFSDDMESGDRWGNVLPWALTDEDAHSGTHSFTDSPYGNYENNIDKSIVAHIDLGNSVRPLLSFWHRYSFESYHDFGWLEVSRDGGSNWKRVFFVTGASYGQWLKDEVDLSEYAGSDILIRFRITSDNNGVTNDGWYIDDVEIVENTEVAPYPFFDGFEGDGSNWILSSWKSYSSDSYQGIWSVTDSPVGVMGSWVNSAMTLRGLIDLIDVSNPKLSFWYKFDANSGDYLCVYISTNRGNTWTRIWQFGNTSDRTDWTNVQLDLSPYRSSRVSIKFQVEDRGGGNGGGAWIDNVLIDDAPVDVLMNVPENIGEHSMTVSWSEFPYTDFLMYRLYRSTSPGITGQRTEDVLIAEITNRSQVTFTDTLDDPGTTYYYRIFVDDAQGFTSKGSNEVSATTLLGISDQGYPMSDDMESGDNWANSFPWQLTAEDAHSGTHAFSDSPGGNYENNIDRSLMTVVDLSRANRPLLSFWHRYSFETYHDFGWVEVSSDGGSNWTRLFFVTGASYGEWLKEEIDLSEYAGSEILIRFRITSDNNGITNDGWYIDDVQVTENTATIAFPFVENFEQGARANWILASWSDELSDTAHGGRYAITDSSLGKLGNGAHNRLTLRGAIDLLNTVNPVLSFWYKFNGGRYDHLYVDVSTDGGHHWTQIWNLDAGWNGLNRPDWSRVELDLSPYRSRNVVIRFNVCDCGDWDGNGAWIDDVSITGAEGLFESISIDPGEQSVLTGDTIQFSATGIDHEGNTAPVQPRLVTWGVRGDIGIINEDGLFTAVNPGIGAVTATYGNGISDITGIIEVVQPAGGTPQIEGGNVTLSDASVPADDSLYFKAYIAERPDEILSQSSAGCAYGSGHWQVNLANFPTAWVPGEHLHLDFIDSVNGETASLEYALTYGGQAHDVVLAPVSYQLITTPATDLNAITLFKDSGVSNAEELVQAIPNALEIYYWDAVHQAYIGHSKGSPLMNFQVKPGYPYLVSVSAPGTWTPTGSVPDPWPEFGLITTGATDVNMITIPPRMQRITNAEELGSLVPGCTEVTVWDAENQGYVGHSYGTPLYNFELDILRPVFVTVTDESILQMKATVSKGAGSGIPQNEGGYVYASDGTVLSTGDVTFRAWIVGREDDVLTNESVGCGFEDGYWQINVGNFATPWRAGDLVHVECSAGGQSGSLEFYLDWNGSIHRDIHLGESIMPAGADLDGDIDGEDIAILAKSYGSKPGDACYNSFCDVNGNDSVDDQDVEAFAEGFGK